VLTARARAVARTEALFIAGLVLFVAAAWIIERAALGGAPARLVDPLALALSAVPAFLWLGYFYLQDRHEPEPKEYVAGVYLLGAFVAWPIARYMQALWPAPAFGAPPSAATVFFAIIPGGLAQELAKYIVVRYSVYMSAEFDEPMDGIVYMMAAGIGFATAENWHAASAAGGTVFLATYAMNVVVTTLAHGCFAGVLGYALGIARWAGPARRGPTVLVGLLVAATLNGLFNLLDERVRISGMSVEAWRSLVFTIAFAAAVFVATNLLMRRHLAASPLAPTRGAADV